MKLEDFEVLVCRVNSGLREMFPSFPEENGYIKLKHLEKYFLGIRNRSASSVLATVTIDGKNVGGFIIKQGGFLSLDTIPGSGKQFTFIASGTREAIGTIDNLAAEERGLIKVDFQKEKQIYPLHEACIEQPRSYGGGQSTKSIERSGGTGLSGTSNQRFKTVDFEVDTSETWTIYLRLIADVEKRYQTIIPPPLN